MAHLAIAYVSETSALAFPLQATTESAGFKAWLHPIPDQLLDHAPWVEDQLRAAWAVLVVLTPNTHTDPALVYQWAVALGAQVPVIPLVAEPLDVLPPLAQHDPVALDDSAAWLGRLHQVARTVSADAIPHPGDASPLLVARDQLSSPTAAERAAAIAQIAASDQPAAHDLLVAALAHPVYADVRHAAANALAQRANPDAIPALVAALADTVESVTQAVIAALVSFGADAIPALHTAVKSNARWQRNGAVLALTRIDTGDTVPALIDALGVEHWYSSRAAAARLAQLGDTRAVPALRAALERDDPHLQQLAQRALESLAVQQTT